MTFSELVHRPLHLVVVWAGGTGHRSLEVKEWLDGSGMQ